MSFEVANKAPEKRFFYKSVLNEFQQKVKNGLRAMKVSQLVTVMFLLPTGRKEADASWLTSCIQNVDGMEMTFFLDID